MDITWWSDKKKRHATYKVEVDEYKNDTPDDMIFDIRVVSFNKVHVDVTQEPSHQTPS